MKNPFQTKSIRLCWSSDNPDVADWPISNLPADAVEVRRELRADSFAAALVTMKNGSVRKYYFTMKESSLELVGPFAIDRVETIPEVVVNKIFCGAAFDL